MDVKCEFSKEAANRADDFVFYPSQRKSMRKDGRLVVEFKAGGMMEMGWHLLMWGEHVKVLKLRNFWEKFQRLKGIPILP